MKKVVLVLSLLVATLPLFAFEFKDDLIIESGFGVGFGSFLPYRYSTYYDPVVLDVNVNVSNHFNLWFGEKVVKNEIPEKEKSQVAEHTGSEKNTSKKVVVHYSNRPTRSYGESSSTYKRRRSGQDNLPEMERTDKKEKTTAAKRYQYNPGLILGLGMGYRASSRSLSGGGFTSFINGPYLSVGFGNRLFFYNNTELDINISGVVGILNFSVPQGFLSLEFVRLYPYNDMMMGWKVSLETGTVLFKCNIGYVLRF